LLKSVRLDGAETSVRKGSSYLSISMATLPQCHFVFRPAHLAMTLDGRPEHTKAPSLVVSGPRANDMIVCRHLVAAVPVQCVAVRGVHIEDKPSTGSQAPQHRTERCVQVLNRQQVVEAVEQAEHRVEMLSHSELPSIGLNEWNVRRIRSSILQHRP